MSAFYSIDDHIWHRGKTNSISREALNISGRVAAKAGDTIQVKLKNLKGELLDLTGTVNNIEQAKEAEDYRFRININILDFRDEENSLQDIIDNDK